MYVLYRGKERKLHESGKGQFVLIKGKRIYLRPETIRKQKLGGSGGCVFNPKSSRCVSLKRNVGRGVIRMPEMTRSKLETLMAKCLKDKKGRCQTVSSQLKKGLKKKKCAYRITRGPRKGRLCGVGVRGAGLRCSKHRKMKLTPKKVAPRSLLSPYQRGYTLL